ncbi:MAG: nuclear transport factor 2 family protein [Flavobacterium sp.]|nr:MAG: nuclear transport factor 2 family protein [Flavobacterium sp.]
MTQEFAAAFAQSWINAWNCHDLEKILSHYTEDFRIETPMAAKLYPQSGGFVNGKDEVRKYWTIGLERSPDLEFELLGLFLGVDSVGLFLYNKSSKRRSFELMSFDAGLKVSRAIVTYSS